MLRLERRWLYTLVKMMKYGLDNHPRFFAVREMTHILQHGAVITAGEERFESF